MTPHSTARFATALLLHFAAISGLSTSVLAQQRINLNYGDVLVREDFREPNDNWPMLTTVENLFVFDKDEYFMHRRNSSSPYAIMFKWENTYSTYQILASMTLGPMEREDQTVGIILQVQTDGTGGFVMEVNRYKQVRVKKLVGNYYSYISGTAEERGWVKGNVKGREEYNEFDVRVNGAQVDFYLNRKFVASADAPDYKPGSMGIIIGADTKAKADYFYVFTTGEGRGEGAANQQEKKENLSVKDELVKVKYDLEQAKRSLASKEAELKLNSERSQLEIERITKDNESLMTRVRQLQEFKNQLDVDIDGDVFLTLAGNLREELKKNAILEDEVEIYKDSLRINNEKFRKFKLTMLDGAITKAERDKKKREIDDAVLTTATINAELKEKQWKAEQEKYEADRRKEVAKKIEDARKKGKTGDVSDPSIVAPATDAATPETKAAPTKPEAKPASVVAKPEPVVAKPEPVVAKPEPVMEEKKTATPTTKPGEVVKAAPLPIITRKATRIKD